MAEQTADQKKLNKLLLLASAKGDTDAVKAAIAAGANDVCKDQALISASKNGHTGTVKALLDAGVHMHAQNDCALIQVSAFEQALFWAREKGHTEIVELLETAAAPPARPAAAAPAPPALRV